MAEEMIVDKGGREERVRVNYPSNAKKNRDEPKKPIIEGETPEAREAKKVITGDVVRRKKKFKSKLGDSFAADGSGSVGDYVIAEVLVPAAKNMISDAIKMLTDSIFEGFQQALFGGSRPRRDSRPGYTSYNRVKPTTAYDTRRENNRQIRAVHDFDDILLASRGEAEDVLDQLRELISQYEMAKVSDLYDLVGLTGSFADEKWGWTDLSRATVRLERGGGYLLILPRTEPLD
jgi:hypothetical protein